MSAPQRRIITTGNKATCLHREFEDKPPCACGNDMSSCMYCGVTRHELSKEKDEKYLLGLRSRIEELKERQVFSREEALAVRWILRKLRKRGSSNVPPQFKRPLRVFAQRVALLLKEMGIEEE